MSDDEDNISFGTQSIPDGDADIEAEGEGEGEKEDKEISLLSQDDYYDINEDKRRIPDSERTTQPTLTKFEKARVLGARALQISKNAPIFVDPGDEIDEYKIAEMELIKKKMPLIIRRFMPDGTFEDWKVNELDI
ncbi:unnamed protein product [Moneuplotes crassus]|uniref:Uncharacterized protein n=1 Tax=Euplotes crassus TaxID=5936 RepID=A0AAD1Y3H3_EUPCR|nr:unnamed protein product [Moneuplotes crassus]